MTTTNVYNVTTTHPAAPVELPTLGTSATLDNILVEQKNKVIALICARKLDEAQLILDTLAPLWEKAGYSYKTRELALRITHERSLRFVASTKIVRTREGEWVVRAIDQRGVRYPECDYYAVDKDDAEQTALAMLPG